MILYITSGGIGRYIGILQESPCLIVLPEPKMKMLLANFNEGVVSVSPWSSPIYFIVYIAFVSESDSICEYHSNNINLTHVRAFHCCFNK